MNQKEHEDIPENSTQRRRPKNRRRHHDPHRPTGRDLAGRPVSEEIRKRRYVIKDTKKKSGNPLRIFGGLFRRPRLHCKRCGQEYAGSWRKDIRCPKCGRKAEPILFWEGAVCLFFPPAAVGAYLTQVKTSPRNALQLLIIGIAGSIGWAVFYYVLKHSDFGS